MPISTWSLGLKSNCRGVPTFLMTLFASSVWPIGASGWVMLGTRARRDFTSASIALSASSPSAASAFSRFPSATSSIRFAASFSLPVAWATSFCRRRVSSTFWSRPLRRDSTSTIRSTSATTSGATLRSTQFLRTASAFSTTHFRSSMGDSLSDRRRLFDVGTCLSAFRRQPLPDPLPEPREPGRFRLSNAQGEGFEHERRGQHRQTYRFPPRRFLCRSPRNRRTRTPPAFQRPASSAFGRTPGQRRPVPNSRWSISIQRSGGGSTTRLIDYFYRGRRPHCPAR